MVENIFHNKIPNFKNMSTYGFKSKSEGYFYVINLMKNQFEMTVKISTDADISTKVIELSSNEEYILHKVQGISGSFVGKIKEEYENVLLDIAQKCFEKEVFKSEYAKAVIKYIKEKYQDEPEFLWEKFSQNAIFRRKDNKKWYVVLLNLSKRKIGLDSDEFIDIIDLRGEPAWIVEFVDKVKYFPGYHMNKKHWFTLYLDGTVSLHEIFEKIDASFDIAKEK